MLPINVACVEAGSPVSSLWVRDRRMRAVSGYDRKDLNDDEEALVRNLKYRIGIMVLLFL